MALTRDTILTHMDKETILAQRFTLMYRHVIAYTPNMNACAGREGGRRGVVCF